MQRVIYKRKIIDEILRYLYDPVALVFYGARQVGKTFILYWLKSYLSQKKEPVYYLDLEERKYLEILNQGPENLKKLLIENGFDFKKRIFVLIDEIQYLKNPTNFLKLATDHYPNLKLIVSGSSTFEIRKKFEKALVGRILVFEVFGLSFELVFEVFGLSFEEFLIFKGYSKGTEPILTKIKEEELKELFKEFILGGSYPKIALIPEKDKKEKYIWQIIDTYLKKKKKNIYGRLLILILKKILEI
ncbi:MAG: hypothetical protein B6D56_07060 [Candidatus Omnitrophica bacterium 4484_70.1]|nr:MAG: hypothetical protein B6D56_07060 [Candidatus Omnitrophica bacterium 4484_70.1]